MRRGCSPANPMMGYAIVRMVDTAARITANPYSRMGFRLEESVIYRDTVRYHLSKLGPAAREAVLLMAEGYTESAAAKIVGLPRSTLRYSLNRMWVN
jgi:hypothetical protein